MRSKMPYIRRRAVALACWTGLTSAAAIAQTPVSDDGIAAEIAATERRVAALKRLQQLRAEEAALSTALGMALAQAPVVAAAPAAPSTRGASPATESTNAPDAPAVATPDAAGGKKTLPKKNEDPKDLPDWRKELKFGVGVSATFDIGDTDRVSEASVVGGLVRVRDLNNNPARIMLESHYFFKPPGTFLGVDREMWGVGPFVAIQPGGGEIIDAIGFGLMVGFKRNKETENSFNIGMGVVMDPNVKVLGDGVVANQPPPPGEADARLRETSQIGLLGVVSFSF